MPTGRAAWILLLLAAAPGVAAAAARTPDSLAFVREGFATRGTDPAVVALAERVLTRRAAVRGARAGDVAEAWEWLGRLRLLRVEYTAADTAFQRAVELRRGARPADARASADALGWLAEAQRVTKQLARAETTAVASLAAFARLSPPDTASEIRVRGTLGNVHAERGRGPLAVAELERVVELASGRHAPDSLQLGQALRNLGRARSVAGDLRGALADFDHAAEVQEASGGAARAQLATTLMLSAMTASSLGDGVAARRAAERALAIREQVFGPDHPAVAVTLSTLGGAHRLLGDDEGAIPLYERAVDVMRAAPRPNPFDFALALNNLGNACLATGDGERARRCLLEARQVRERAFGPGSGSGPYSRTRLAEALLLLGRPDSAAAELAPALAGLRANAGPQSDLDLGDALAIGGRIDWALGRRAEAIAAFGDAAARRAAAAGEGSPYTLETLALRAAARLATGDREGALADARRIEEASRDLLSHSARSLAEHEALALERRRASGLDVWLTLATDSLGLDAQGRRDLADAVVRARLLVLDQLAEERRALRAERPVFAPAARELESARDALASALVEALRQDRAPDSAATRARQRREAAELELARQSEAFAVNLRRAGAGLAEVAAQLGPGTALVSFVRYGLPATLPEARDSSPARYAALITRAGGAPPEVVALGDADPIEAAVSRWLEACATPPPIGESLARAAERRCDALGRTVHDRVWSPLASRLAGARRVFIVPDGVLHAVNFLALPSPRGGRLVERGAVLHRLTAERDLLPWPGEPAGRGLLAMGGPDFDRATGSAPLLASATARSTDETAHLRFAPLPQTAAEVGEVAALWRASGIADAADVRAWTGAEATEGAFEQAAPGRRVLHLATHGFALGDTAAATAALAGRRGVGAITTGTGRAARLRRSPMLAGLALAGANAPSAGGVEDGFLTAEEITSLDLSGVEWAVLSACETGRPDPTAAEAVQGLQRAFRRAGVRTVIMSLWAVDDATTREWMRGLYEARLLRRLDTAAATTEACRGWLRARRARRLDTHPFHWAAFVAAGDWR